MPKPAEYQFSGRIKFFNTEKGFGFIEDDDAEQPDIFFHVSRFPLGYLPNEGDRVKGYCVEQESKEQDAVSSLTDYPGREAIIKKQLAALSKPPIPVPVAEEMVEEELKPSSGKSRFLGEWF